GADPNSTSPMWIGFAQSVSEDEILLPARTATLYTDDLMDPVTTTLCIPETIVPGYDLTNQTSGVLYFYDVNGTPYHDSLLTDPVLDSGCNTLLANSFTPINIQSGVLNILYNDSTDFSMSLGRNGESLGWLEGDGTIMGYWSDGGADPNSTSPMWIGFASSMNNDPINLPENKATLETDDLEDPVTTTLCVPETTIPSYDPINQTSEGVLYFYNQLGKPYSDNLLTKRVLCDAPENFVCGDINSDGVVDGLDVEDMNDYVNGGMEPVEGYCYDPCADITGEGLIGAVDLTLLVNQVFQQKSFKDQGIECPCGRCPQCGDNEIQPLLGEECDGEELSGITCEDVGFLGGGTLACYPRNNANACSFDTSGCLPECALDSDCNDGDPCTVDWCNQFESNGICETWPAQCGPLDSCCPTGCTATQDRDCSSIDPCANIYCKKQPFHICCQSNQLIK
ncbi:dockerin type I repeat-containing protein, partial [Patescibacteria group bacterium]